jgi:hypothetical protein
MATGDDLRAGDADRDRTIALIREAYTEGRLDNAEFETRMGSAQQARTYGELAELVRDLPVQPPTAATVAVPTSTPAAPPVPVETDEEDGNLRKGWAAWVGVGVLVNVIWLGTWITGDEGTPPYWPIWVWGPWGAAMLIGTLSRRNR